MYIYLAHPIDLTGDNDSVSIYHYAEEARDALLTYGATVIYTPSLAFQARYPMNRAIQDINMYAISKCDAMMAFLPHGVHTIGVPFEIGYAYAMELPMVIVRGNSSEDCAERRAESALLSWLDTPMFGFDALQFAAMTTLKLAHSRMAQ